MLRNVQCLLSRIDWRKRLPSAGWHYVLHQSTLSIIIRSQLKNVPGMKTNYLLKTSTETSMVAKKPTSSIKSFDTSVSDRTFDMYYNGTDIVGLSTKPKHPTAYLNNSRIRTGDYLISEGVVRFWVFLRPLQLPLFFSYIAGLQSQHRRAVRFRGVGKREGATKYHSYNLKHLQDH